jgi:Fur family transcriptional regulator, ferric uptake regulator
MHEAGMDLPPTDFNETLLSWQARLAASGYRVSAKNQAILETILRSERALDPLAIFEAVRKQYPGIGLVTVYRTLNKLEELGLVEHLHQDNGCNLLLRARQGHQHLLVCSRCGKVVHFTGDDLARLVEQVARQTSFVIQVHWLQFFGLCAACSELPAGQV